jgi:hypothetical protein
VFNRIRAIEKRNCKQLRGQERAKAIDEAIRSLKKPTITRADVERYAKRASSRRK